ncbi:MAG: glycerol-3-phosphate dehydrogenase C-terminal domain-containing protein [Bacteroidia bacterium]
MKAELTFAFEHEAVQRPLDFLNRRTGRLYFHIESVEQYGEAIVEEFARFFNWNASQTQSELDALQQAIADAREFPLS